jgi:valyl-tRNA synthetase
MNYEEYLQIFFLSPEARANRNIVERLANVDATFSLVPIERPAHSISFRNGDITTYLVVGEEAIIAYKDGAVKRLAELRKGYDKAKALLDNPNFVKRAPIDVVETQMRIVKDNAANIDEIIATAKANGVNLET